MSNVINLRLVPCSAFWLLSDHIIIILNLVMNSDVNPSSFSVESNYPMSISSQIYRGMSSNTALFKLPYGYISDHEYKVMTELKFPNFRTHSKRFIKIVRQHRQKEPWG